MLQLFFYLVIILTFALRKDGTVEYFIIYTTDT